MLGRFGIGEIVFVLALLLFFFGAKKIPLIARGIGEGIRNFKTGLKDSEQIEAGRSSEEKTPGNDRD